MNRARLMSLVEDANLNALLKAVDQLCSLRLWDELLDLADMCEEAVERGKQLWPIAQHIDYRIALEAPGDYAAGVLDPRSARFAAGPLTEVAASTHKWRELAPHLETPQVAGYVAQERVLRGERLDDDGRTHPEILELPLHLLDWEPTYALASFLAHEVEVAEPWDPRAPMSPASGEPADELDEPELVSALLDLVQPWTSESNGATRAAVVEGDVSAAVATVAFGPLLIGPLEVAEAVQRMAWAASSGGAHGRRRGAALGRSLAWYTGALLADLPGPVDGDELGAALGNLRWYRWEERDEVHEEGWILRLAVEDPHNGWSAALSASDLLTEDDEENG